MIQENTSMQSSAMIELQDVCKTYSLPAGDVVALDNVSLTINEGEFVAIMGPSGSGKSTLLNLIGSLDVPSSGTLAIAGKNTKEMSDNELTLLRRDRIGYIFQQFNLIALLTAYENVEYPYLLKNHGVDTTGKVATLLRHVGIDAAMSTHIPAKLSGGQQQRVAIARALVNDPDLLLCDEPTGNLDSKTGTQIMDLLSGSNQQGRTVVMVTHDLKIAEYANRVINLNDGRVV
jgi:putative ABC transport system ATP-binding protein